MKYTQTTLDKIENLIEETGYIIRYERGTFQSGFCILEDKKVVVLNKFLQLEGRINTLIELLPQLKIATDVLADCTRILLRSLLSFLSLEVHTTQLQAIMGTPLLVPVPRNVIFSDG